jgi:hypothetical protein
VSYDFMILIGVGVLAFASIATFLASSRSNAILIPHSPGNLAALNEQMRNAMLEADQTIKASDAVLAPLPELTLASEGSRTPYGHKHQAAKHTPGNGG